MRDRFYEPVKSDIMSKDSLTKCFSNSFLTHKEKPAITFLRDGQVETQISYLELEQDANRMASMFQALGVEKGDRVILFIPKSLIFKETAKTFEQGWFKTGDLGHIDGDGYYYLTDRIKHIIISGGENISPQEIESVINQVKGVAESSVVGITDEKWGEKVVAVVVKEPDAGVSADEIQTHCKKHLHDWKCPKEIAFVKELPRNTMGKVLKEEVKQFFY